MVFYVLACSASAPWPSCGARPISWRWPIFQIAYMTALAWVGAFLVFQGGKLFGFH
ncbi:MAG: hypothetical protein WDN28_31210 [Chthoniobacter sp.]